jgi:hypothetical protein
MGYILLYHIAQGDERIYQALYNGTRRFRIEFG